MAIVGISEPSRRPVGWAPFALGFRPFFLLAGLAALLLIALWATAFARGALPANYYGYIGWHSHEMLFGYSSAVIAGFLLTAVRNWTGVQTLRGAPLAALASLWLAGRIVPFVAAPPWLVAAVDLAFLPLFAAALAAPMVRAQHYKSLLFVAVVLALTLANALVHLELLGVWQGGAAVGIYLALDLIVLTIVIMGGRVMPFFTEKALPGFVRREWRWVEWLAAPSVLLLVAADVLAMQSPWVAAAGALAAVVHGVRLYGWYTARVWRVPLLWVLQLGYAWMVLGFALKAAAVLGGVPPMSAVHALTVGGIGGVTLGMMARVALGHTGRPLQAAPAVSVAFALVYLAAALRVFGPWGWPQHHTAWVVLSGALWALAFLLFVERYVGVLLRARVDGQPG